MEQTAERDRKLFQLAQEFLLKQEIPGVDEALLEKYMTLPLVQGRPQTINVIYEQLLWSVQSGGMDAKVVGGAIGGIDKLGQVLDGFDPTAVLARYGVAWEPLLDTIVEQLQPRGQIRRGPRSIWPKYCRAVLSSAAFLTQFDDVVDFYRWADFFDHDDRSRLALPMLLEAEIDGLGFALACDFLKELGYLDFGKPDVHIRDIFVGLRLCPARVSDYALLKLMVRMARHVGRTPYAVDKLLWLIGSGHFYEDPHIGDNGRTGRRKQAFIDYVQARLNPA